VQSGIPGEEEMFTMSGKNPDSPSSKAGGHAAERLKEFLQQRFEETSHSGDEIDHENEDSAEKENPEDQPTNLGD
jgi:hypothetical protein